MVQLLPNLMVYLNIVTHCLWSGIGANYRWRFLTWVEVMLRTVRSLKSTMVNSSHPTSCRGTGTRLPRMLVVALLLRLLSIFSRIFLMTLRRLQSQMFSPMFSVLMRCLTTLMLLLGLKHSRVLFKTNGGRLWGLSSIPWRMISRLGS